MCHSEGDDGRYQREGCSHEASKALTAGENNYLGFGEAVLMK